MRASGFSRKCMRWTGARSCFCAWLGWDCWSSRHGSSGASGGYFEATNRAISVLLGWTTIERAVAVARKPLSRPAHKWGQLWRHTFQLPVLHHAAPSSAGGNGWPIFQAADLLGQRLEGNGRLRGGAAGGCEKDESGSGWHTGLECIEISLHHFCLSPTAGRDCLLVRCPAECRVAWAYSPGKPCPGPDSPTGL